jgi:hypothetical protein
MQHLDTLIRQVNLVDGSGAPRLSPMSAFASSASP